MDKKEKVKLDQVLKFLFTTSNRVLIKLLNGLFNENFNEDEVNISISGNEFIEDNLDTIKGDMFYTALKKNNEKINYHIEFQTKNDSSMVIRTFEYGFKKAKEESINEKKMKTIYFPKQKVIFFEENKNIEDSLKMRIVFPNEKEYIYEVEVMKYWEYTTEDLIAKKLYPLIPLQLFNLRKELNKLEKENKDEDIKNLSEKAKRLAKTLAEASNKLLKEEEIYGEDFHKLLLGIQNLIEYLNRAYFKSKKLEKEVEIMTKTLYDPEVEERGKESGIELAKKVFKLFNQKQTLETIAKECNITVEKVKKILE
ncbi:MAG: coiled-coil domain-containing protein [Clostridium sp.]|uniref:coiled-coil domain-containing protein n=1 Tax=Clostridium sp. TaxID=1506 RepID=UPI003F35E80D